MERIYLIIADESTEYIELLKNYIRETEYADVFLVKTFTGKENIGKYLMEHEDINILLIDPTILPEKEFLQTIDCVILLQDRNNHLSENNFLIINKYQPLNQFFSKIIVSYQESKQYIVSKENDKQKTTVISVYSTVGGSGKTTMALNLAKQIGLRDKKIFYLNLEYLNSTKLFFPTSGTNDLAKILYYIKANSKQIDTKIEALKKYDNITKIEYFEPFLNSREMLEITKEDIDILIDSLIKIGSYNYIIIDLDSTMHERIIAALNKSNHVFWLLVDDYQYIAKTNLLLSEFENIYNGNMQALSKKIRFILNKHLGKPLINQFSEREIKVRGFLPYIPEWKIINQSEQIFVSEPYIEEIVKLYNSLHYLKPIN